MSGVRFLSLWRLSAATLWLLALPACPALVSDDYQDGSAAEAGGDAGSGGQANVAGATQAAGGNQASGTAGAGVGGQPDPTGAGGQPDPAGAGGMPDPPGPTCSDGVKNGSETDIDCGDQCPNKCALGQGCTKASDCVSQICAQGACVVPPCENGVKDGQEADVDCGTACATKCALGQGCKNNGDCEKDTKCDKGTCKEK